MNFFSKLISKLKLLIPIAFSIILVILYLFFNVSDEEKIPNVKEEYKYEEPDSQIKTDIEEKLDEKKETREIVKDKLDKKQNIKEKKEIKPKKKKVENLEKKNLKISHPTQTISKLHQGLKKISGQNLGIYNSTKKLITETYDTEKMLKMIIGDSWKNLNNEIKKEIINVFEEYIAKNYIKRFSKIKNLQFSSLEEKKIGTYKTVKSNLILSNDEKVSISYLLSLKKQEWKIFDVLLAGSVSEIATKKSEFKSFIVNGNINPLIDALKKKNKILIENY
jgi:phospholipid transport system substrate-binding protein